MFSPVINLSQLDGNDGFAILGVNSKDNSGQTVTGIGDVDGDGLADILIGAQAGEPIGALNDNRGEVYILFGGSDVDDNGTFQLSSLIFNNSTNGLIISGDDPAGLFSSALTALGDINSDGFVDFAVGARGANPLDRSGAGKTYIFYGGNQFNNSSNIDFRLTPDYLDGTTGFIINGAAASERSGQALSSTDFNGDSIPDVVIGARAATSNGFFLSTQTKIYVAFGGNSFGESGDVDLASLNNGITIEGEFSGFGAGSSALAGLADFNGDGFGDLVIGESTADTNGLLGNGIVYVVYGGENTPSNINLGNLGNNGFSIAGGLSNGQLGADVDSAGDINGDGLTDLIFSEPRAAVNGNSSAGKVYVVLGQTDTITGDLSVQDLSSVNSFVIEGLEGSGLLGTALNTLGDINDDGFDDFAISGIGESSGAGSVYVIFGDANIGATGSIDLSQLDGNNGFRLQGAANGDNAGIDISSVGDFNGDGVGDLLVGAYFADPNGNGQSGESYIVYGIADERTANEAPVSEDDVFNVSKNNDVDFNVLSNDIDPDGDALTIIALNGQMITPSGDITLPSGAILTLNQDATVNYDPNSAFDFLTSQQSANDSFTYTIDDGNDATSTATVNVTVVNSNFDPTANPDSGTVNEDETLQLFALSNDTDSNNDPLSVTQID
ncbi:MAG: Ig-like domain-containing protein, partial [Cyanobacteria bacterium P01_H01_bin.15]